MAIYARRREPVVPRPLEELFGFFSAARNLQKITPPWLNFQILTPEPICTQPGTLLDYRLKWHGLGIRWRTRIVTWNPPHVFTDEQVRGPYRLWHNTLTFPAKTGATGLVAAMNSEHPAAILGSVA